MAYTTWTQHVKIYENTDCLIRLPDHVRDQLKSGEAVFTVAQKDHKYIKVKQNLIKQQKLTKTHISPEERIKLHKLQINDLMASKGCFDCECNDSERLVLVDKETGKISKYYIAAVYSDKLKEELLSKTIVLCKICYKNRKHGEMLIGEDNYQRYYCAICGLGIHSRLLITDYKGTIKSEKIRKPMIFESIFCGSCYLETFKDGNQYAEIEKFNMAERRIK